MDFDAVKIAGKDFFYIMSQPCRPWEDGVSHTMDPY